MKMKTLQGENYRFCLALRLQIPLLRVPVSLHKLNARIVCLFCGVFDCLFNIRPVTKNIFRLSTKVTRAFKNADPCAQCCQKGNQFRKCASAELMLGSGGPPDLSHGLGLLLQEVTGQSGFN